MLNLNNNNNNYNYCNNHTIDFYEMGLQQLCDADVIEIKSATNFISQIPDNYAADARIHTILNKINQVFDAQSDLHEKNSKLRNKMYKACINSGNELMALRLLCHPILLEKKDKLLLKAADKGLKKLCVGLIEKGANINAQDIFGHTSLFRAVNNNDTELAINLLDMKADPNIFIPYESSSPLSVAIMRQNPVVVRALLHAGANINTKNIYALTPLDQAKQQGNPEIIEILTNFGDTSSEFSSEQSFISIV